MAKEKCMKLTTLLSGIAPVGIRMDTTICDVFTDSRQVKSQSLFIALPGNLSDGRHYFSQAVQAGASAIVYEPKELPDGAFKQMQALSEQVFFIPVDDLSMQVAKIVARFYDFPAQHLSMIAITGTNGKTSCACQLATCLDWLRRSAGMIGSIGAGRPGALLMQYGLTTPDPCNFQKILHTFRSQGCQHVVFEASSHGLAQQRLGDAHTTPVDVAIFTNLSHEHMDFHGDMARYAQTKRSLFERPLLSSAVINLDDPWGESFIKATKAETIIGFSMNDQTFEDLPVIQASNVHSTLTQLSFDVTSPWGHASIALNLLGTFQVMNVLAVLAAMVALGIAWSDAIAAIQHISAIPGRMNLFQRPGLPAVIVDYAHTDQALATVLKAIRPLTDGQLWCVFGCGGERDHSKRPLMGQVAEQYSDHLILTDDNPRGESPQAIIEAIKSGLVCPWAVTVEHDRATAIQMAITQAKPEDIILVAGKGHETTAIVGGESIPYSDIKQVKQALEVAHA